MISRLNYWQYRAIDRGNIKKKTIYCNKEKCERVCVFVAMVLNKAYMHIEKKRKKWKSRIIHYKCRSIACNWTYENSLPFIQSTSTSAYWWSPRFSFIYFYSYFFFILYRCRRHRHLMNTTCNCVKGQKKNGPNCFVKGNYKSDYHCWLRWPENIKRKRALKQNTIHKIEFATHECNILIVCSFTISSICVCVCLERRLLSIGQFRFGLVFRRKRPNNYRKMILDSLHKTWHD